MTSLDVVRGTPVGAALIGTAARPSKGGGFGQVFQGALNDVPSTIVSGRQPVESVNADQDERDAAASVANAHTGLQTALADFMKEAQKTPAERAHDQILAKHHLGEEGYKALPSDAKKLIDQEILARTRLLIKNSASLGDMPVNAAGA